MKAAITPGKAKRRSIRGTRTPRARRATEKVFDLTNALESQLQQLDKAFAVKAEIVPSPGGTLTVPPGVPSGDIMALAFIVMMEAAKSAQEDLKAIMNGVKSINKAKAEWRAALGEANAKAASDSNAAFQVVATLYVRHVAAEMRALHRKVGNLSELGELESLRLQMLMDRLAKLIATLTNLLNLLADTASRITQT